jgi:hypothetical protein
MKHRSLRTILPAVAAIALTGCGGNLVAPEGSASNAFLDQVDANCGNLNIGSQPIRYLLSGQGNDTYFIDQTSKLSAGEIDRSTYTNDINSFYPAGANSRALDCIFAQLDGG